MYMYSRLAISRSPREQFLPFSTIFCYLLLDFHVKTGTRFSLRDKRLFEISEVEITNRLYMGRAKKKNVSSRRMGTVKDPEQPAKAPLFLYHITKTCLYNFDPLKPHFYIVKLRFPGVYISFVISGQKHRLWVLVRTASTRRF